MFNVVTSGDIVVPFSTLTNMDPKVATLEAIFREIFITKTKVRTFDFIDLADKSLKKTDVIQLERKEGVIIAMT